ncbi:WecB/TagA/CpsF family glycosyltransferase [Aminobacter sp. HY435]|uniref:WecB/TagA/CpsF family glycosyltransferase n=1 Tax=Aminobacter sp. HY435 TaxID=2970917 RepID=UPI0022B9AB1B|nr:WecB/TagA/CpsF family glycosyltransferase [Aminobacter sp. HY435]
MVKAVGPFRKISFRRILGIDVASASRQQALALLSGLIASKTFAKVSFLNAHNANIACSDSEFAAALSHFLVLADGIGVDIASRLLYGAPFPDNLNGTDFVPALLRSSDQPLTVALLGAKQAHADHAADRLAELAPQHRYIVVHDGYFTAEEEPAIVAEIGSLRPDILLVAMGVPRQELWIERNIRAEHCTLPIAVGALLDFLSGSVPRAPLWMRRLRLEWLFRLMLEPGRLWRRYVVGNPLFLLRVLRQKFAARSGEGRP